MRCHISTLTKDDYFLSVDLYGLNLYKFISVGVYESWYPEANSKSSVSYYTLNDKVRKLSGTDVVIVKCSDIQRCGEDQISVQMSLVEHFLRSYPQSSDRVTILRLQDPFISDNNACSSSSASSSTSINNNNNNSSRNTSSASSSSDMSASREFSAESTSVYLSLFTKSVRGAVNQKHLANGSTSSSQASTGSSDIKRNSSETIGSPVKSPRSQNITYCDISESDRDYLKRNSELGNKKRDNYRNQNVLNKSLTSCNSSQVKKKTDALSDSQHEKQKTSEEHSARIVIELLDDSESETEIETETETITVPKIPIETHYIKQHFVVVKRVSDGKIIMCKV